MTSSSAFAIFVFALLQPIPHSALSDDTSQTDNSILMLDDAGLTAAFAGRTHTGFYRDFLTQYNAIKFQEIYRADGTLLYQGGGIVSAGTWTIQSGRICFTYDNPAFIPGCFAVRTDKGCFYSHEAPRPDENHTPVTKDWSDEWWIVSYFAGGTAKCEESALIG